MLTAAMIKAAISVTLSLFTALALVTLVTAGTARADQIRPACIGNGSGQCYVPPPCTGASCVGQDPQTLGCGGANGSSLASVTAPGGGASITLRWSDWCQANWADISVSDWGDDWFTETANGHIERYSGDGTWTFMVDGTQLARACIQGYGHANYACTAWY
jgi:hypothetical protein